MPRHAAVFGRGVSRPIAFCSLVFCTNNMRDQEALHKLDGDPLQLNPRPCELPPQLWGQISDLWLLLHTRLGLLAIVTSGP